MKPDLHILLIEDDPIMGESLMERFELEGFHARWAHTGAEGRQWLARGGFGVVLSDLRLPDMGGDALFREALENHPILPPWLFITGYGAVDQAVQLLKLGAADYLTKPFDLDALVDKLKLYALAMPPAPAVQDAGLGISPALRRIEAQLPQLAEKARTLLITGESGVGKEMVARAFHRLAGCSQGRPKNSLAPSGGGSDRREGAGAHTPPEGEGAPFVAVNCGAFPEGLLEAELFGHERGAFTGAVRSRKGVFEQADGGTLFLDEIGDMPFAMQVKLLRVIQERRVTRVGGDKAIPVDIRLISATHQDLKKRVTQGLFREDLYYRLNVIQIHIPPLRQRREDILWLARRFLLEAAPDKRLSEEAEQALLTHDWPGNARELKHAVERGAILAQGQAVGVAALFGDEAAAEEATPASLADFVARSERRYIAKTLDECAGHLGRTAETLGISRKNLWEKMKKLGLSVNGAET